MPSALLAASPATRTHGLRYRHLGVAALAGGLTVVGGTLLPWITLYAGLHAYRGVEGLYGKVLLCGALFASVCALRAVSVSRSTLARWYLTVTSGLGALLLGATLWLVRGVFETTTGLARDPMAAMAVPRAGAGLFVCLAGAIVLVIASVIGRMSTELPTVR